MNKNAIIDLKNISVTFGDNQVLKNLNLYIRDKEFITFLGPSGCGKTTTLRIIAGFIEPDEGEVIFEGKKINGVPPHKRQVNTIRTDDPDCDKRGSEQQHPDRVFRESCTGI